MEWNKRNNKMKFRFMKVTLASLFLLISCFANSGIISDTSSDLIGANLGGLEWLEFDVTRGLSSAEVTSDILDSYDGGNWRYATTAQAEALITSLAGGNFTNSGWNENYFAGVNWFQMAFGSFPLSYFTEHYFMYDKDAYGAGLGRAGYTALNQGNGKGWLSQSWGVSGGLATVRGLGGGSSSYSHMLVRNLSGTPSQDVPEPSTLIIFALGLIGLASRRFNK